MIPPGHLPSSRSLARADRAADGFPRRRLSGHTKTAYLRCAETTPCKMPPPRQRVGSPAAHDPRVSTTSSVPDETHPAHVVYPWLSRFYLEVILFLVYSVDTAGLSLRRNGCKGYGKLESKPGTANRSLPRGPVWDKGPLATSNVASESRKAAPSGKWQARCALKSQTS